MPEIGTSGLMSGERKRSVAVRPKSPRLSSTLQISLPTLLKRYRDEFDRGAAVVESNLAGNLLRLAKGEAAPR